MPSEVSDIKQFIEICRRKDASCTFYNSVVGGRVLEEEVVRWGNWTVERGYHDGDKN
jgi:hypothetical protein